MLLVIVGGWFKLDFLFVLALSDTLPLLHDLFRNIIDLLFMPLVVLFHVVGSGLIDFGEACGWMLTILLGVVVEGRAE